MFYNPRPSNLRSEQMEGSSEYLARTRRLVMLRGAIFDAPTRWDVFSPVSVHDSILAFNAQDAVSPIYLLINSPGGEVGDGFMLYDLIRASQAPLITIGQNVASMATVILAAGKRRLLFPNSTIMLHLPFGGMQGDTKDLEIRTAMMGMLRDQIVRSYIECGVKKTEKQILKDIDREFWMNAKEAIDYGLADGIITPEELMRGNLS